MNELGLLTQYLKELAKASRTKGLPTDWAPPDERFALPSRQSNSGVSYGGGNEKN